MRTVEILYKNLYKAEGIDKEQAKRNILTLDKKLTPDENKQISSFFKETEINRATKEMKNNKTPGEDGIPKEFYLHFYSHIKVSLMEMLTGELTPSLKML